MFYTFLTFSRRLDRLRRPVRMNRPTRWRHVEAALIRQALYFMVSAVMLWSWAPPAQAYLDPGAGSALLQALIGGVALMTAVIAHQWHRLRTWLSRRSSSASADRQER